ncbi:flippase-like domain-containing protein [Paenibacillus sp. 481]|uniref:flippase-like domain-containing protein n=1 Tax=Paenibacillus sp. 481 TaxID=2835869 RepID=UPI001E620DB0|nr:flippase-like domain-containing protein [Paenibacillus sp. 481]UHA73242.1 lysylphosphatidylglycerol synthetase family protein [Paenibacillus sp. 481]
MNALKMRLQALLKHRPLIKALKIVIPIAVSIFVIYQGKKEISRFSIKESLQAIRLISNEYFTALIVLGAVAVATMYFYDMLLLRSLHIPVKLGKTFRVSWIANTFNGIVGFGGIAGVGIRAGLYRELVPEPSRLLISLAWMAPAMISGLSLLGLLVIIGLCPAYVLLHIKGWLWVVLIGVTLFFPAYLAFSHWKGRRSANWRLTFGYTVVSFVEWLAAGSVMYIILRLLDAQISYAAAIGIFTVSAIAGIISMVPGGFGTFDITLLLGVTAIGVPDQIVFTALLLYRLVYYIIPFALGLIFAAFEFGGVAVKRYEAHPTLGAYIETGSIIWFIQQAIWESLASWSVVILLFMTSVFLFIYTLFTPELKQVALTVHILGPTVYPYANGIVFGGALLILLQLKGLFERTIRAYSVTSAALILCAIATFLIGTSVRHTLWLAGMLLFLFLLRRQYTRYRYPLMKGTFIVSMVAIGAIIFVYTWIGYTFAALHRTEEYISYTLSGAQFTITIITGFMMALLLFVVGYFRYERHSLARFGIDWEQGNQGSDRLLYTVSGWIYDHSPNKRLITVHHGEVQFPCMLSGRKVIVLDVPSLLLASQALKKAHAALQELYKQADQHGLDVLFFPVGSKAMPLLHDYGNDFIRVGEIARIEVAADKLRPPLCRYELLPFPLTAEFVHGLEQVVRHWAHIAPAYSQTLKQLLSVHSDQLQLIVVHNAHERYVAYAVVHKVHDTLRAQAKLTIEDVHCAYEAGTPEYATAMSHLRDCLIWRAKTERCTELVTGLLPLSHVGTYVAPHLWSERTAIAIFRRVRDLYPLDGQRNWWETMFNTSWEPQYMSFPKQRQLNWTVWKVTKMLRKLRKIRRTSP